MTTLNVEQLLRVSPAVVPRPAEVTPRVDPLPYQETEFADADVTDHYKEARQLMDEGEMDEAEKHFRQAAELDPRSAKIAKDFGDFLKITGRHEEAIKEYIRAREIDPNDPDAYFRRGLLYEESGVPEKAITMYEEAMEHGAGVDTQKRIEQIKQKMAVTENAQPEGSDEADSKIQ